MTSERKAREFVDLYGYDDALLLSSEMLEEERQATNKREELEKELETIK